MGLPDFQSVMLPLLKKFHSCGELSSQEAISFSIKHFKLTKEEISKLLPSKTQKVINNRVYWSLVYLQRAGLISKVKRGLYKVNTEANNVINDDIDKITIKYLRKYPSFVEFQNISKTKDTNQEDDDKDDQDPFEQFESKYKKLKNEILAEIISTIRKMDPADFEKLCLILMQKIGYGDTVQHTGRSGDHGKDGKVLVDSLGLDTILLQTKRYKEGNSIPEREIRDFIGSLNIHKALKGLFITASHFTPTCEQIIKKVPVKIVLIDGEKLSELLFEHNVGLEIKNNYEIKEMNQEFFDNISQEFLKVA